MKLNTKTRYGIRAMIELALNQGINGILQKEISENQEISFKYLDQIIASLKSEGLITTLSGRKSGYVLSKPASEITVYDIFKAFNPELAVIECINHENTCKKENICITRNYWNGLNQLIINYMKNETLDNLAKKQKEININNQNNQNLMFHI